jgi:hypothetical protein
MVGWAGKRDGERMKWTYHRKDTEMEKDISI